jgi:hypothetical protein
MIEQKKALAEQIVGTGESWLTDLSTAALREVLTLSPEAVSLWAVSLWAVLLWAAHHEPGWRVGLEGAVRVLRADRRRGRDQGQEQARRDRRAVVVPAVHRGP